MIHRRWFKFSRPLSGWLVVLPSILIVALMLLLTPVSSASPVPIEMSAAKAQAATPVCQSCHPQEYDAWKNTPHSQSNGASCEACHGPYKEGHPAKTTMQLPMASTTCQTCHSATFTEWQDSKHADKNIECFDCHNAHTQGLRTGTEEKLCAACHSERQTQVAHATHGISGVMCANCHMAPEGQTGGSGKDASTVATQGAVRSHNFKVSSDVCAKCHEGDVHSGSQMVSLQNTLKTMDPKALQDQASRVPELQKQVNDLQNRLGSISNAAVLTMGFAFGLGGFLGLLAGVIGAALWHRRNQ